MSAHPVHPLRSGIEVLSRLLLDSHDALVVSASALHRGFAAPEAWMDARVNRSSDAASAVRYAAGRSWGGQQAALILEGRRVTEALPEFERARKAGHPLVVVLWPDPDELALVLRRAMEAELTLLSAGSMTETLDLTTVATLTARSIGAPCLVLGPVREGPWSLGRFSTLDMPIPEPARRAPTLDPSRPLSIGWPMPARLRLKQQAGRAAARPDVAAVIERAMDQVSQLTGRFLHASPEDLSRGPNLVFPASTAPVGMLDPGVKSLNLLFPVPDRPAGAAPTAVILPAGTGSDPLHPLVRAFDPLPRHHARPNRRFFSRHSETDQPHEPLTILAEAGTDWSHAHLEALKGALQDQAGGPTMRVVDARLSADTRIPAIEEQVHASRQDGLDPAQLDIPVPRSGSMPAGILIGCRHPEDAFQLAHSILESAPSGAVGSPLRDTDGGEALVWVHLHGVPLPDPVFHVLLPDARVLDHRELRHRIPAEARVWIPDHVAGHLPPWLSRERRSVGLVPELADWTTVWRHPAARPALEADFRPVEAEAPEDRRAPDAATDPMRNGFLRTLGHLQDQDRLDEAPVDPWILSGTSPAATARPNRWTSGQRPIPHVINEKCTGCAACWTVCPEAAFTVRSFTVAELIGGAMERAGGTFVHLPRLQAPWIQTAHQLVRSDDLGQYRDAAGLLNESLDRLLASAGATGPKADAIRAEAGRVMAQVDRQSVIRTTDWFSDNEAHQAGSGLLLAMQVDPSACTRCGLCTEACPESALEELVDPSAGADFRQLDAWPVAASERSSDAPQRLLTGPSTSACFRPGSTDRANLNRTVLRQAVEAHAGATKHVQHAVLDAVDASILQIETAMQDTAQQRIRINDFADFDRQLQDAAGKVSEVLQTLLSSGSPETEDLTDLSTLHRRLSEIRGTLTTQAPALILVDSLDVRQTGLSSFPSNPFAFPSLHLDRPAAGASIRGLLDASEVRLARLAQLMRTARETVHGTHTPGESAPTNEDRSWARQHLPRVLWLVDRADSQVPALLRSGLPVHIVWLDGGPEAGSEPAWTIRDITERVSPAATVSAVASFSVELLERLIRMAAHASGLTHVLSLDPTRDGVALEELERVLAIGVQAGLIADGTTPQATMADWMVPQERFRGHFRRLGRKEHAADQLPLADWLNLDPRERERSTPCVFAGTGANVTRWIPDATMISQSEAWWKRLQITAAATAQETAPPSVQGSPEIQPGTAAPEPTEDADIHARLTERLLALSGFQHGGSSLQGWLETRLAAAEENDA